MRALPLMLTTLLAVACDSILGIPSQEAQTDGGVVSTLCNPDADSSECFRCTDQNCCSEYMACHADPRCADYYKTCLPNCKASGTAYYDCVVQCDKQYGAGHAVYAPYFACGSRHCLAPCSNGPPDGCAACLFASCADQDYACTADRDCDTLFNCLTGCNGSANADQCSAGCKAGVSPTAQNAASAELACALTYCQNACAGQVP